MPEVKDGVMMSCNSASTVRRMLSHMIGILVAIATALLGFGLLVVLAGLFGLMEPVWRGGKALFFPTLGAPCVAISGIVFYVIMAILRNTSRFQESSYIFVVTGEALVGLLFLPCSLAIIVIAQIGGFIVQTVSGGSSIGLALNPYWVWVMGFMLTMTAILSIASSYAIVLGLLRTKKVSSSSGDNS